MVVLGNHNDYLQLVGNNRERLNTRLVWYSDDYCKGDI